MKWGNFNLSYGKLFAKLFLEKAEIASPIHINLSVNPEQFTSSLISYLRHFVGAYSVDLRNGGAGLLHQDRIVDLSAIGDGSKIGRIGLDQKSVERHCTASLAHSFGIFERDRSRKRDIPTALNYLLDHLGAHRTAVKHSDDARIATDHIKGICVGIAVVDDDGEAVFFGYFHLL